MPTSLLPLYITEDVVVEWLVGNYVGKAGSAVFDILTVFDTVNAIVILHLFNSQNNLFYMVPCTDLNSICK